MNATFPTLVEHPLVELLGWTLLHSIWQAAAIALPLAVVLRVLRGSTASLRYGIACVGMFTMALLPAVTFLILVANSNPGRWQLTQRDSAAHYLAPIDSSLLSPIDLELHSSSAENLVGLDRSALTLNSPQGETSSADALATPFSLDVARWTPVITGAWFLGVMILSLRLLGGLWKVHRLRRCAQLIDDHRLVRLIELLKQRMKLCWPVELLQSTETTIPTVVGFWRPAIIVPLGIISGLTNSEVESILAHEIAHIRRRDWLVNLGQSVIEVLLFYHPAVWWVSAVIRHERENCCDDAAVAVCGDRLALARALVRLEESRCASGRLAISATGGRLVDRIRRILLPPKLCPSAQWPAGLIALGTTLLLVGGLWASVMAAVSHPADDPDSATSQFEARVENGDEKMPTEYSGDSPSDSISAPALQDQGEGKTIVEESGYSPMPPLSPADVGRVVATHTYNLARRESTGWVEIEGTRHPVDEGVEHDGVKVYMTLMFDIVAVESANGKVLWKLDWNKLMPTWQTISILEIERPSGKALVVELTPRQNQEKENQAQRLYLYLTTGDEVKPQARQNEIAHAGWSQDENAPTVPPIDPKDWGRVAEISGLQTRLTLQTEQPQVGQPLLVKLELRNAGNKPAVFDPQDYAPFRVLRVNAARTRAPTPFIGMTPQTSGQKENLDPGDSRLLWEKIDVSELFLLAEEGDYEVYAKGGDWATQTLWRDSNRLRVTLQEGHLPPRQELISALLKVKPDHWTLSVGRDEIYLQHSPTNLKQDITHLSLRFTRGKLAADTEIAWPVPGGDRQFATATINYLGETDLGHAYLLSLPRHTETLWPGYLEIITQALENTFQIDGQFSSGFIHREDLIRHADSDRPWSVTGRVTDAEGNPLANVTVNAHCGIGTLHNTGSTVTGADGRYDLKFGPGFMSSDLQVIQAATISVHLDGHVEQNLYRQGDCVAALEMPEDKIGWGGKTIDDLFLPGKPKELNFVMVPAARLQGVITDVHGDPLDGVRVSLTGDHLPPSSSVVETTRTDKGGRFELTGVPTGFQWQLLVEPAQAGPPWKGWATPPMTFCSSSDGWTHVMLPHDDRMFDLSWQTLKIVLNGSGDHWRSALADAAKQPLRVDENLLRSIDSRPLNPRPEDSIMSRTSETVTIEIGRSK